MLRNQPTTVLASDVSHASRLYVSGEFHDLFVLDSTTLAEIDQIPLEAERHLRHSILENEDDENELIAVSETPFDRVLLYDLKTKECVNRLIGASGLGLETISNSSLLSSNPIIISGGKRKILAFDSITSEVLSEFPNPSVVACRISHFPEWNQNGVFIGGMNPFLSQYDLNQERCVLLSGNYNGHNHWVHGLSASLSNGILLSGGDDQTLKCWNFNQFDSCVHSIQLEDRCHSVKYLENLNLVCCGTIFEIEIFDIRNLNQRIRRVENLGNGFVSDVNVIFSNSLCVSGCGRFVSSWNPLTGAMVQKQECDGLVWGVQVQDSNMMIRRMQGEDLNERIEFLLSLLLMKSEEEEEEDDDDDDLMMFGAMVDLYVVLRTVRVMKWMILME